MSKYMVIDGNRIEFDKEKNILDLVRKAGIDLPTLCYYTDLSVYGACRMCVVEDERGSILTSCSTPPKDMMSIRTNTPKLQKYRKVILELLLATYCRDCTICEKNGKCKLQKLASRFGLTNIRFKSIEGKKDLDTSSKSIIRDPNKCILCGDCVRMCNEIQSVGAIDFANRGSNMVVSPAFGKSLAETDCVNCGQCATVCPTGAIVVKSDIKNVWKAIYNHKQRVIAQVAPAVRVALGEEFGIKPGENVMGKIVAAMRKLGFENIYDTSLSADLTVIEESKEFLKKLESDDNKFPLFTSCCPAWVRYVENKYTELLPYVSSCKSPMEMFGSVVKAYFKEKDSLENRETISVAVMPCTAKKAEAAREEFIRDNIPDVDYVITTAELCAMIKEIGIQFDEIEAEASDIPLSLYSGAGVIFGVTGGVTEAVIREVVKDKSSRVLKDIEFIGVRGMKGVKTCELQVKDESIRIGIVSGLRNAEDLIEKIKSGEEHFDFIEVMACPGGCIAGAGQPFGLMEEKNERAKGLYKIDKVTQIKRSEENLVVKSLYEGLLKNRTKELLHVHYDKSEH
ncbi:MAG: [FeFe] hydrogenase, group A [Clostridium beijerinckii]|jgi:NADH-quinone oxidoreductase subunit G|uniref:[FeFe] hydrogenase, group A n=1 Tax=Clostridium beijerinckii TaxID=1520 RepID=UPI00242A3882|nr:[FeFe] hydrogenase, group A [Clostridium beijerinckii]MCI1477896.1 [FeFe] hydrogenase, group A [Clostridium beijerinckii]MCI1578475.1 [FeFe] hydrogenase, group A [Clostridium beijerinckii]MCI1583907.1 [FeFe] hydrogenase, group A [Clostridium beijerinckii]MCI1621593.1 [FeFe] hydrogenase, group A [Clostridium beijerinckii]MDG5856344.1 [FeFe] hydrogenase, group A [Clostridium beijerinckii]